MRTLLLLILLISSAPLSAQTIYAVVLGNQKYVVGSSTLHSGLFRSSDTGRTWEHLGPRNLKAYSMDAVDSSLGRILYIAAGNGVHKSTDSGRTWKIMTDWRMTEVMDVKVDQSDPRWVYAATAWGFWRSSDGGETWENPESAFKQRYVSRLYEFLGHTYSGIQDTVYLLDHDDFDTIAVGTFVRKRPENIKTIYDESFRGDRISRGEVAGYYASSTGIWEAVNSGNGAEYHRISDGLPTNIVHALTWLSHWPSKPLLAGTWGEGIYRREGDTWHPSGLEGSQVWRLVVKEY